MPSPKLIQILRSRSTLSDEQIIELTDEQAWELIYEIDAREKAERDANRKPTVCFTGFNKADKAAMEATAVQRGLKPVQNVSQSLNYLVLGETPGKTKISKAEEAGTEILHAHEYEELFQDKQKPKAVKTTTTQQGNKSGNSIEYGKSSVEPAYSSSPSPSLTPPKEQVVMEQKVKQGCVGCLTLIVLGGALIGLMAQCSPDKQQPKALQTCESQVKSGLAFPDSYVSIGTGAGKFTTIQADDEMESVSWQFQFKDQKPDTIVGQAQNNPLAIGTAICEINKKTGVVIGKRVE